MEPHGPSLGAAFSILKRVFIALRRAGASDAMHPVARFPFDGWRLARLSSAFNTSASALRAFKAIKAEKRLALGAGLSEETLVFADKLGNPWKPSTFTTAYSALLKRNRLRHVTFHGLRHSHATHLLEQNLHPKVVSERLGHSTVRITMDLYPHVMPTLQEEAARKTDALLTRFGMS